MRRTSIVLLALVVTTGSLRGEDRVTLPWAEFRELWSRCVERELAERLRPAEEIPTEDCVDGLAVALDLHESGRVEGTLTVEGRHLAGTPRLLSVLGAPAMLLAAEEVTGARLAQGPDGAVAFRAAGTDEAFRLRLRFAAALRRDERSWRLVMPVVRALRNRVTLKLPAGWSCLDAEGRPFPAGERNLPPVEGLDLRFLAPGEDLARRDPEVDELFRIEPLGEAVDLVGRFLLVDGRKRELQMELPDGLELVEHDLPGEALAREAGSLSLRVPAGRDLFTCRFRGPGGRIVLPRIRSNRGREGAFVLREPEDGELRVDGLDELPLHGMDRLAPPLRAEAGAWTAYRRLPPGRSLALRLSPLARVAAPSVVLDQVELLATVEEGGAVLSVLRLVVPAGVGPRLRLPAVAGTRVWSLEVNGRPARVFASRPDEWILPLARGGESRVELALLRHGDALGLRGRIDLTFPATGLAARRMLVAVALPERVELVSVDGPVTPSTWRPASPPAGFRGRCHAFERAFDEGRGAVVALSYKEPAASRRKGNEQ